jgi:hypothetical protein
MVLSANDFPTSLWPGLRRMASRGETVPTERFLSTKTHKEFDCEHPRVLVLQVIEFSRQMGTGRSKPGYIETGSWQPVEERTVNHAFWKAACRKP